MKRITAINHILKNVKEELVISSTGMISREVYALKDRDKNFYMMGSMGNSLAIGIGIAINSNHKIIVISGDGETLISLGTLALYKKLNPKNLTHYILDNNCHATTGGQKTCSDAIDFKKISPRSIIIKTSKEKGNSPRIPFSPRTIKNRFKNAISNSS